MSHLLTFQSKYIQNINLMVLNMHHDLFVSVYYICNVFCHPFFKVLRNEIAYWFGTESDANNTEDTMNVSDEDAEDVE